MEKGNKLNFNEILFWLKKKDLAIFLKKAFISLPKKKKIMMGY
jgi:hypothetical protein